MSKHRVLSFKAQLRLEWRGQDGQNETEQPDHSASLGDSITSSTQIKFSVYTQGAVSVFLFFNRQWFPVRRRLRTDYAVFDARDARVGRPGLTALVPKSFHIARPAVIVQQNEHPVSRCGTDVPPFAHCAGP